MWRTLGISEPDWQQTPVAVQTRLRSQYHEAHSLRLRSISYQGQIASLTEPAALIERLNRRIASQQKQIVHLQQQLTETAQRSVEIARLNAEIAVLKEKLGQNSRKREFAAVLRLSVWQTGSEARTIRQQTRSAGGTHRSWAQPQTNFRS